MSERKRMVLIVTLVSIVGTIVVWIRFGGRFACIMAGAGLFSFGIVYPLSRRSKKLSDIIALAGKSDSDNSFEFFAFLAVITAMWAWAVIDIISGGTFAMLGLAVPFTALFIGPIISGAIRKKHPKPEMAVPVSRYEKNPEIHIKRLNIINTVLYFVMFGLTALSFFLIPYELGTDAFVLLIPQVTFFLILCISAYWSGGFQRNNTSKASEEKLAKISVVAGIVSGNPSSYNTVSAEKQLKKEGVKVFARRWSVQGFYVVLIILLPFWSMMLSLPEYYGVKLNSLWEYSLYSIQHIPFVQVIVLLLFIAYIVSYFPLTLAGFLNEKYRISVDKYKNVKWKQYFRRNIIMSFVFVIIAVGLLLGASYGTDNSQSQLIKDINEQLENADGKQKIVISDEISSTEFNNDDYAYMQDKIIEELGDNAVYKLATLDNAQTDENGEKYITATFAGYGDNYDQVIIFSFRKYLTSSNKHDIDDVELYQCWATQAMDKEDIK